MTRSIPTAIDQWSPFTIHPDGTVTQAVGVECPELQPLHADADGQVADEPADPSGWTLLTGWTGQYGYHGPVMHPSEYVGGSLLDSLFSEAADDGTPVTYVCLPVESDDDGEAFGWAIARRDAATLLQLRDAASDALTAATDNYAAAVKAYEDSRPGARS